MARIGLMNNRPPLLGFLVQLPFRLFYRFARFLPGARMFAETRETQVPIDLYRWFWQRIVGINAGAYWPMHPTSSVTWPQHIKIGVETSPGWSAGCLIHGVNGIYIGDYTQISQNVGIISGDHDPYHLPDQIPAKPIRIGKYCLLGMNSVILPEVEIGDYTIVAANTVVATSYPDGFVVLAGVPARIVRRLDPALRRDVGSRYEYNGYIATAKFAEFERRNLILK